MAGGCLVAARFSTSVHRLSTAGLYHGAGTGIICATKVRRYVAMATCLETLTHRKVCAPDWRIRKRDLLE